MSNTTSFLHRRYAVGGPPPQRLQRSTLPHYFDKVHDSYGPGVVLGWLCVAYGVAAHAALPSSSPSTLNVLDKDLVMTLAYPLVAAMHLIVQFVHYPGPRTGIRTTTDEALYQYGAAISAANTICILSLGVNLMLGGYVVRESKRRVRLIIAASATIFFAVLVANSRDGEGAFLYLFGIVGAGMAFMTAPVLAWCPCYFLLIGVGYVYRVLRRKRYAEISRLALWMPLALAVYGVGAGMCGAGLLFVFYAPIATMSGSPLVELGQASALGFGLINLMFSGYGVVKEIDVDWWAWLQD
jgi:hypothetical protein